METFKRIQRLTLEDTTPFYVYRSVNTGITVCIAYLNGPLITGSFNIVTETCDNDGLPYAVEHLIFTGSDEYPYNILKLWAERSLGYNITACTLQNCTNFTMSAATMEGFLTLMPIYLDHILYPSLKDSAFLTEVHHINGEGKNAGVVYRKTQEKEHTPRHIIDKEVLQALYPGHRGYNSVRYGTTKNLRESTNNEKVKHFHEKFYQPENLTILITGNIKKHRYIFQALLPLEQKIMSKKRKNIFKKPSQVSIEPLENSVEDVKFFFPSYEIYGEVCIAWQKPSAMYDYYGCLLLLQYLMKTTSSPLLQEFLKIHDTCDFTWSSWKDLSDPYFHITLKNVPVEKCDLISKQYIHKVISEICIEDINKESMERSCHDLLLDYRIDLDENNPHDTIARILFNQIVHNNTDKVNQVSFYYIRTLEKLKMKATTNLEHFLDLFKKYFVDAPMVVIKGIPSLDKYVNMFKEEEERINEQIEKLGKEGLLQKEKELKEAIEKNNIPVPEEVLTKIFTPSRNCNHHYLARSDTQSSSQLSLFDVKQLPLFTYVDDVISNVFYLQVIMDASSISTENRFYIPLLVDVITQSPVKKENQLIYENLKNALFDDTIKVSTSYSGINTAKHIAHNMSLLLQVDLHNYENSIKWCKKILYDTKLTADSLKTSITKLLYNINEDKVQGERLVESLIDILLCTDDNLRFTYNMLWQYKFLSDIEERLNTDVGQKEVMAEVESVRQTLTSPKNMFVYMAVNVKKLIEQVPDVSAPWNKYFSEFISAETPKMNITSNWKPFTFYNRFTYNGCIVGLEWINSTFFMQTCSCVTDYQHPDWPALEVCLTYFSQEGGPLWKDIREQQEYSDHFKFYTIDGLLNLKFTSVRNVVAVYQMIKEIVETHCDKTKWNKYFYERAKVSLILNCIINVSSIRRMINTSLTCYCTNVPYTTYIESLPQRIFEVSLDDMSRAVTEYIKPLFDPTQCRTAIVCNISKVAEIEKAFQEMKFNFNVCKSFEEINDYIY